MPSILTLVAPRGAGLLTDALVRRVRDAAKAGEPDWLAPGEAVELACQAAPEAAAVRAALADVPVDFAATDPAGRRKRLLVADMDSTIVTGETLDELAAYAGVGDAVAAITRRSMNGDLDFAAALRARVGMLSGLALDALEATWRKVKLTPGAKELVATMRAHGATAALVSGGFTFFTGRVAKLCGFDVHRANVLLDNGNALLGTVAKPILDRDAKRSVLRELAAARGLDLSETLAVGDGANDLDMLADAGMGVAYRAKPVVAERARVRVDHTDLRALLYFQGYRAEEILAGGQSQSVNAG